jgi:hypothetical protein
MSSEVARDVIWALRTAGADLTADEVFIRIADSLGHNYPQVEVDNIFEDLARQVRHSRARLLVAQRTSGWAQGL